MSSCHRLLTAIARAAYDSIGLGNSIDAVGSVFVELEDAEDYWAEYGP